MSSLPVVPWHPDPVFFQIPRDIVIAIAGVVAAYSLLQGLRRKGGDHYTTAALFAVLGFVAYQYMKDGLEIRYYSLLFVGVFLGGYALLKWQIVRGGGPAHDAGDFIVYGVLGVLLGARLGHVLFYDLDKALADPAWVFKIWTGGLASHGAVLGLISAMYLFTKRRGIAFLEGSDRFAFSAALGATLVRIGNLMNSEIVGRAVPGQTWGFRFPLFDDRGYFEQHGIIREDRVPLRYPTQILEISLGLLVLGALFLIDRRLGREKRPRGALIASFFLIYFSGRFFIEFFKEYEGISPNSPLTMGQILSLPGILLGIYGLVWAFKRRLPAGWPNDEELDDADEEEEVVPRRKRRPERVAAATAAPGDDDSTKSAGREDAARDEDEDEDDTDNDDDEHDEHDNDDDEHDDHDDERPSDAAPLKSVPNVDPDVADEFDEKGALKRKRE